MLAFRAQCGPRLPTFRLGTWSFFALVGSISLSLSSCLSKHLTQAVLPGMTVCPMRERCRL